MPRIRTVKPEFFKHYDLYLAEKESGLPLRLGFQGLWLCADKQGVFRWQPEVLKLDILPYDEIDFKKLLEFLLKERFIGSFKAADGKHYGIIPSFQDHQRINGTEKVNPPIYPSPSNDYNPGSFEAILGSTKEALGMDGREGKGREKEGKGREGKEASPNASLENLTYDIEDFLKKNRAQFEGICMAAQKTEIEVWPVLKKFHLWNQEKETYPKKPQALIAGLQKWLIDEKKFNSNGNNSGSHGENSHTTIKPRGGFGKL